MLLSLRLLLGQAMDGTALEDDFRAIEADGAAAGEGIGDDAEHAGVWAGLLLGGQNEDSQAIAP